MDLKLADVSRLLNVSKSTIRRWLAEGKIPAYRLGNQYRFSPMEIEAWVMSQKMGNTPQHDSADKFQLGIDEEDDEEEVGQGQNQFSFYRALNKGLVQSAPGGTNKEEVIRQAVNVMGPHLNLDADLTAELLLDRERLMSTALGFGLAVPHTREIHLEEGQDVINVLFLEEPIAYDALDGQPVHTLFFLFAADDKRHLHLLSKIAHLARDPDTLPLLKARPNKMRLLKHIRSFEASLRG